MKKSMMYLRGSVLFGLVFLFAAGLAETFLSNEAIAQIRPALVQDVENPAQNPFWSYGYEFSQQGMVNFFVKLDPVPTGKRLTLEFVSIICTAPADDSIYDVRISVFKKTPAMTSMQYPIYIQKQGTDYNGKTTWVASQPVRLYLDSISLGGSGPEKIFVNVFHKNWNDPDNSVLCVVDISGSLVNAP